MGRKYTNHDRALLLGTMGAVTVVTYLLIESIRNSAGDSYLSVWPLGGYEAVLILLIGFIAASIDVYRDLVTGE